MEPISIYLTSKQTGNKLRIPLLPDRLSVRTGAYTIPLNIIKTGEIRIPRGAVLTGYSWNGVFPGESMQSLNFVYDWQAPEKIIKLLTEWEHAGETLTFTVGRLGINSDVFIESFTYDYFGFDSVSYTLNLTVRKELFVKTTKPPAVSEQGGGSEGEKKKYGTVKTNGSKLSVRKKASSKAKVIGKLKNKTKVEILGKEGNWYIIPWEKGVDGKGYVSASYIKLDGAGSSSGGGKKSSSGKNKNKKKSTSSGKGKKSSTTPSSKGSTDTSTGKKSLVISKPTTKLIDTAKKAFKVAVTGVAAAGAALGVASRLRKK